MGTPHADRLHDLVISFNCVNRCPQSRREATRDQAPGDRLTADGVEMEHIIEDVGPVCEAQLEIKQRHVVPKCGASGGVVRTPAQLHLAVKIGASVECLFDVRALEDLTMRKRRIPDWHFKNSARGREHRHETQLILKRWFAPSIGVPPLVLLSNVDNGRDPAVSTPEARLY